MTSYCPVPGPVPTSPANNEYKPGFSAALMLKDLRLSQEGHFLKIKNTTGKKATAIYEEMKKNGSDDLDLEL